MAKRKFTVKQVAQALVKAGGYKTHAAKALGCTYQTVLNYIENNPELDDVLDAIVEENKDIAEFVVNGMLRSGARKLSSKKCCKECGAPPVLPGKIEVDVAMKFLRYKGSDRGYVDRHEFSGPNGGPIETKETGVVLLPALAKPVRPKAKPKAKAKPKKRSKKK